MSNFQENLEAGTLQKFPKDFSPLKSFHTTPMNLYVNK